MDALLFKLSVSVNNNGQIVIDRESVNAHDMQMLHENNGHCLPIVELKQILATCHDKVAEIEREIGRL